LISSGSEANPLAAAAAVAAGMAVARLEEAMALRGLQGRESHAVKSAGLHCGVGGGSGPPLARIAP
jgi:hypothetical protein